MTPGQRNHNLLILAFQLNKHRVPATEALNLCLRMQQDGFPASEVYTVVSNAYRTGEVGCRGCRWCGEQAPPPPSPYRVNTGFALTPEQRQQLVAALRKARRQQAVTSTPTPAEGVTSSTAVTTSGPVTTSTDCKEQARATPEATIAPTPSPRRVIVMRTERGRAQYLVAIVRDPVLRLTFETGNRRGALLMREREALETLNEYRTRDRSAPPCALVYL